MQHGSTLEIQPVTREAVKSLRGFFCGDGRTWLKKNARRCHRRGRKAALREIIQSGDFDGRVVEPVGRNCFLDKG